MIIAVPMKFKNAAAFIADNHRHNKAPAGAMYCVGAAHEDRVVGVAMVGRPVSRHLDDGKTLEVVRCCVLADAPKGTCSFLYARCRKAVQALGWGKLLTYTLQSESGASLRGAGWVIDAELKPNSVSGWQTRPGRAAQTVVAEAKLRWVAIL